MDFENPEKVPFNNMVDNVFYPPFVPFFQGLLFIMMFATIGNLCMKLSKVVLLKLSNYWSKIKQKLTSKRVHFFHPFEHFLNFFTIIFSITFCKFGPETQNVIPIIKSLNENEFDFLKNGSNFLQVEKL